MASADLSRRVGKVVGYPPLSELFTTSPRAQSVKQDWTKFAPWVGSPAQ
jgi:hypothetical protein